jgi:hypothetical protein
MRLTEAAIKAINVKSIRPLLALALGKSEQSIIRYIGSNEENGMLTTAAALKVVTEQTGLKLDEILIEEKEVITA